MILEVYLRDQGICWICGSHVDPCDASMDHVVPYSMGGEDHLSNLRLAHQRCNAARGAGGRQIRPVVATSRMKRLQEWMERNGKMSQAALARRMNISPALVSVMVSGKRGINGRFIGRFFLAFGPDETQAVFGDRVAVEAGV